MTTINDDDSKQSSSEMDVKVPIVEKTVALETRPKTNDINNARRICFSLFILLILVGIVVTITLLADASKSTSLRNPADQANSVQSDVVVTNTPSAAIIAENPNGNYETLAPVGIPPPPSDVFYNVTMPKAPTGSPITSTNNPIEEPKQPITYVPGNLVVSQNGLKLSQGLSSRLIAQKHQTVVYHSGIRSDEAFHDFPDGAATFTDPDPANAGGWIYVSNSEYRNTQQGGVGAVTFDVNGNVLEYKMVLKNTRANCGGGRTPWGVSGNFLKQTL
jgi:hypothetical protein